MKQLLIILLGLFGVAYAQSPSPTSAKTRFVNGLFSGSKDSTYFTNAGDTIVLYFGRDSAVYARFKGIHRRLAYAGGTDYVPYTGAVTNVNLGNYRLTARSIKTDSIYANSSAGMYLTTNSGTAVAHWGGGGSVEVDFKGFAGYDANRAGSYTARSFTDKNYVDSSAALRVRYTDTAAMLSPYLRRTDSTGLLSQVVRTFGTQTIGGNKTFTNDIFTSTARIGIGAGGNSSNSVLGYNVFTSNTTGTKNTAMGENSLSSNVSATDNTAFGWYSLDAATGSGNTGIGSGALGTNTSGSNNTALGFGAGEYVTGTNPNSTGTNSIYIGFNTKASANGETNQTVIGHNLTGNGSNTVTIGNSSVTDNYFSGNIRASSGTAFLKNMANGGSSDSVLVSNNGEVRKILQSSIGSGAYLPLNGGTLTGGLNGTTANFTGAAQFGKVTIVGTTGESLTTQGIAGEWSQRVTGAASTGNSFGLLIAAGTNSSDFALNAFNQNITTSLFSVKGDGTTTAIGVYNATVGGTNRDVFVDNTGLIGYVSSFRASKKNIVPVSNTDWLHKLNPVTFNYRVKDSTGKYTDSAYKELEYGLVAEEVETVNKEMVFYDVDSSGNKKLRGVHYSKLIIPLLAEVKEHKKRIDAQDKVIEALLTRIKALEAKLN